MRIERLLPGAALFVGALLALPACNIHSISSNLTTTGSGGSGGAAASSTSGAGGATATSGAGGGATATSSSAGATSSSGAGGSVGVPCAPAAGLVYSIATDHTLARIDKVDAGSWADTPVGTISCPTAAEPYSIAIDRSGQAWVGYSDGTLFKVDTATAACTATSFAPGQHGFLSFSMAFASDTPDGDTETLYLSGSGLSGSATGLAKLDRSTLVATFVGAYDDPGVTGPLQLMGKSDGTLKAGIVMGNQYNMLDIAPATAHVISIDATSSLLMHGLPASTVYSGIPWGKYYHFFTTTAEGTRDYTSNPEQGSIGTYGGALGLTSMIAITIGASTCATSGDKSL